MMATCFSNQYLWPLLWKQLSFIFIFYSLSSAQDKSLTCDVPWVEPLANTSVTCHFPINVNETSSFFAVEFKSDDRGKIPQDILSCIWPSGKLVCSIYRPGYKYDKTTQVSNKFSLEILQASTEHIGTYRCYAAYINSKNDCEFRVKVVEKTVCVISSRKPKTRTSLTCYYPEDLNKTRTNFTIYHYPRTGLKEVIVACEWKRNNLTCNTTHGYEFDNRVSDYLTLKIPMSLESQEGAYSCHISGAWSLHYDICIATPEKTMTSTCQIPSVEEAEPTTLTCRFIVDVNMTKRNFAVVHRSNTDRKAAEIANCTWLGAHLDCTTAEGYHFNNTATDHVVIRVLQASHNHSGTYVCHLMGVVDSVFEPCEFIIMPGITTCEIPSVKLMSQTSLTCSFPEDLSKIRSDFTVYHHSIQGITDAVSSCVWKNEKLICSTVHGYEVDGNVTDHVTLRVYNTSKNHEGLYNCQMTDVRSVGYENCSFQLVPSSCSISSVKETRAAELICTFSVDVNETKQNFKVIHLRPDGRKSVLMCIWVGDGLDCTTSPTYEFNNTVSSQLVVRIPRASRDHSGTYACHVLGSKLDGFESCEFMVMTGRCTFNFTQV